MATGEYVVFIEEKDGDGAQWRVTKDHWWEGSETTVCQARESLQRFTLRGAERVANNLFNSSDIYRAGVVHATSLTDHVLHWGPV